MDIKSDATPIPRALLRDEWVAKASSELWIDEAVYGVAKSCEGGGTGLNPEYVQWVRDHA